jgi:BrnA antitoxin of type II toxin-antitoxin system
MNELNPASSFKEAAQPNEHLSIDRAILAWFKARGTGWQNEINGVLAFYIETAEHPASEPEPLTPSAPTMKAHTAPCDGFSKNDPGKRAWFLSFKR